LLLLQEDKGGDLKSVLASEKARFAPEGLVPEVLELYKAWTKGKQTTWRLCGGSFDGGRGENGSARPSRTRPTTTTAQLTLANNIHSHAAVQFDRQQLQRKTNAIQKEIGQKLKVSQLPPFRDGGRSTGPAACTPPQSRADRGFNSHLRPRRTPTSSRRRRLRLTRKLLSWSSRRRRLRTPFARRLEPSETSSTPRCQSRPLR